MLDDQPARRIGMIRYEKFSASERRRPGRSGLISCSAISSVVDRLEPVAQELRLEPDLERLAGERHRQRLLRLADVLGLRRDRHLALREPEPERRVPLRHHGRAPHDLEELLAGQRDLVLEGLGDQLLVVRELPVDPPRRQPDVAGAEDDVVLLDADPSSAASCAIRESSVSARAGTIASSSALAGSSSSVIFTDIRYESVAAMTSFEPSKWTRLRSARDGTRRATLRARPS